jgi:hypothetical protein
MPGLLYTRNQEFFAEQYFWRRYQTQGPAFETSYDVKPRMWVSSTETSDRRPNQQMS